MSFDNNSLLNNIETDNLFQKIYLSMPAPVLIFEELSFSIIAANDAALHLYGYSYEEFLQLTMLDISTEAESTKLTVNQAISKEIQEIPYRYHKKKDGTVFPVEIIPTAIVHDNCHILCGVIKDITMKLQVLNSLRDSEQRYATLVSNLPGIAYRCLFDIYKTIEFISDGCHNLTGYTRKEFTDDNRLLYKIIVPEDRDMIFQETRDSVEKKNTYEIVYRIVTAKGDIRYVMEQGSGISNGDGDIYYLEGFIVNVTEQKKNEFDLQRENTRLRNSVIKSSRFGDMIGKSPVMMDVYETILKASMSDVNVILYGESGTGKELAARAVHELSDRKNKPFIAVNCGAIPHELIENEFFGHKKGAFTGAYADKRGYLDCADGGTLFLDEIGDISQNMQVKLLRALDECGFSPIGGKDIRRPDLRIISATHKDLRSLVRQGVFREDFFYRIHVLSINMPPLRNRIEDIPLLVQHFIQQFSNAIPCSIPSHVLNAMRSYSWPGNVRELKNVIQRFVALKGKTSDQSLLTHLELLQCKKDPDSSPALKGQADELCDVLGTHEREHIRKVLEEQRWHMGKTSEILGIHPKTLARKIKRYSII